MLQGHHKPPVHSHLKEDNTAPLELLSPLEKVAQAGNNMKSKIKPLSLVQLFFRPKDSIVPFNKPIQCQKLLTKKRLFKQMQHILLFSS